MRQRDRELRHRDRHDEKGRIWEGDRSDRLRDTIRRSVHEEKLKIAAGPAKSAKMHEAPAGAPASWDLEAKSQWHELPQETRLAYQREQAQAMNSIESNLKPHLERLGELDRVIAPSRAVFQAYGCTSDAQAVQRLFEWEHALRQDPRVGIQRLAQQLGVDLRELVGAPQQYQQYAQQYQHDPVAAQQEQAVEQHLAEFARGKRHFEAARHCMGLLIQTRGEQYSLPQGGFDLDKAYVDACRNLGLSDNRSRRSAAVSPASRSPAVHAAPEHRGGGSVKNSILNSIRELRG